jgi:drug/metabolite transporter (DMT)-like permease
MHPDKPTRILVAAAPLTFAFLWASGFIVAKYAVPASEPFTFLAARFGIALLLLALLAAVSGAAWPPTARDAWHSVAAGALLHGGYLAGVWWAVAQGLPAGMAGVLSSLQPLLTALLAAPLLGERVTRQQWWGIVVGLIGVPMVLAPRLAAVEPGALAAASVPLLANLVAVLSVTLGTFYQKRFVPAGDLRTGTCLQYAGALAVVVPLALATGDWRLDPTFATLAALAWSVVFMSIGAIFLLLLMIRRGEVSRVAALVYLVPPITVVMALVLFDEQLSLVQWVGIGVTVLGVWLATRQPR